MNKLNFLGIGPRIAIVLLPWLAASIALSCIGIRLFDYPAKASPILLIAGIVLMAIGLVFYLLTARMLLKGLKETRLMTSGPYGVCQNPLYATMILVIIPALSLLLNSWLVLTASLIGYILFKLFIKSEYRELERFFGDEYLEYRKETPEFFPFPKKKGIIS
jgi:protein-S-isoprenylcysteine O-methyltransferase Ste14